MEVEMAKRQLPGSIRLPKPVPSRELRLMRESHEKEHRKNLRKQQKNNRNNQRNYWVQKATRDGYTVRQALFLWKYLLSVIISYHNDRIG